MKSSSKYFLIAFAVVVIDQASKLFVKLNMNLRDSFNVIGSFFQIYFIENDGAAFSLSIDGILSSFGLAMSPETGKVILSVFSIVAVGGIAYMLHRFSTHKSPMPLFVALILGGALGNIIDRTFYGVWFHDINLYDGAFLRGQVVDMFYFDIYKGAYPAWLQWLPWVDENSYLFVFPIFNVADAAISVGICVLLVFQNKFFKMDETANAVAATPMVETAETQLPANGETDSSETQTAETGDNTPSV